MILAIDPGSDKSGAAVVESQNDEIIVNEKKIIKTNKFDLYLERVYNIYDIDEVVLGNSTTAKDMEKSLIKSKQEKGFKYSINIIDEKYSTHEAEKLYIKDNYSFFLNILYKIVSWKPKKPVDDYAAVVLAKRYLTDKKST